MTTLSFSSYETIRFSQDGDVLIMTIDHPDSELNAVDERLHGDLVRLFRELKSDREHRAAVLTASGPAFSAGGDFHWFPRLENLADLDEVRQAGRQLIWDLLDVEVPLVAAINGPAVGLGASIALLCDVIFIAESATLSDPHVRVGIAAGDGGAVAWPLAVGPARAKEYLLTGDPVSAAEAERIGLVNHVSSSGEVLTDALAFARRLAAGAPLAVRYTKLAVNKLIKQALNVAFDVSTALELVTLQSEDHKEALGAIAEKRSPEFRGR